MLEAGGGLSGGQRLSMAGSVGQGQVTVVSYNLYWWNVGQNNRWTELENTIAGQVPFDLIGFQECNSVDQIVRDVPLPGFDFFQGPFPNPCPIAWNTAVFTALGSPGQKWVAADVWGDRWMVWQRLQHKATGATVFFVNTHGPLGNCGSELGNNWADGINANKQAGDIVFMTGDFNCGSGSTAMNIIRGVLPGGIDGGRLRRGRQRSDARPCADASTRPCASSGPCAWRVRRCRAECRLLWC